jgi:hypothetical protein
VCDQLCNKILNMEFKGDKYFVDEMETQLREKSLRAAKPRISTIQKTRLVTKHSHLHTHNAVVIPYTLKCTYTRTPPNQVSYLKGSSMEFFSLGLLPKLDFNGLIKSHNKNPKRASNYLCLCLHTLS